MEEEAPQNQQFVIFLENDMKTQRYLTIKNQSICIGRGQSQILIYLIDLIGVKYDQAQPPKLSKINLISFSKQKKLFRTQKRYIKTIFTFYSLSDKSIKNLLIETLIQKITLRKLNKLSLMIYFNPNAGSNSISHLNKTVQFLQYTNFKYQVLTTNYRGHCEEHLKTLDNSKYCAVVIISGDGLVHQYLNSGINLPLAHIPGGSGNAFAKAQTYYAKQQLSDQNVLYLLTKGRIKDFNVTKYQLQNIQRPIYSFLSFQWAILADIDINSQFLRFMGGARFQLYAVWRLIRMKTYRGRLSYSQNMVELPPLNVDISNDPRFITIQDSLLHLIITNIPFISDKYKMSPCLKLQDQKMDMQLMLQSAGRWSLIKYLAQSDSGNHFNDDKPKQGYNFTHKNIKCFRLQPLGEQIGVFGIDGQQYNSQKIQGIISEIKMQTFC